MASTAVVAVLVAFDLVGLALAILLFALLPLVVPTAIVHCVYRSQMFMANRLTPSFYSHGRFWIIRFFCGRNCSAWALNNYAVKLYSDEQYHASNDAFSRVLQLDEKSAVYWAHRGASRYSIGEYQSAIDDLNVALKLESNHQIALMYRGYTLMATDNYTAALDDLARVECNTSQHSMVAYFRGHLNELLHHWESAIDDYLLAYNLDSTQTDAAISLVRLQAGCPDKDLRDANKAIQNATNLCV
ncbi:Tetratricopeptide TPR_2 repeat-containing protein [Rhodopirellula maiorica SM1]|uniref:Tetratricopeptide TPR_2 repeat-containing protein n=1 Tax=Rhodopirellula maiorica SM1 TaxID=1265738 RepID=M5RM75_9BACT|nr:hypothetical protein [Rhodopirellula maiorica]EMI16492.1 Tetratricopeptide TPR_2 repeat-containing protein [Rhodopirellula maiorica SM1]